MDISFYTAAVGAEHQQYRMNVHSNNIANVNNYGFRARRTAFSNLMANQVRATEKDYMRGVGAILESTEGDYWSTRGGVSIATTNRPLDYAIEGSGFFALEDPVTGEISYSRDGSFTLSELVETETRQPPPMTEEEQEAFDEAVAEALAAGLEPPQPPQPYDVQVNNWYLSDGMGRFVLGRDGQRIKEEHPESVAVGVPHAVGVFDFTNRNGMVSMGDNRFGPVEKNGMVAMRDAKVVQGALENSSTDLAYEFAKVIETQRSFTYILKMVQTSDEITSTVNSLRG